MAQGLVTDTNLTAIADAIRAGLGGSDTYTPAEMAGAILEINDMKANQSIIADVESSTTAAQAYTTGSYLILNNVLYKATAEIAAGDTLTAGTNISATTVMAELVALLGG